MIVDQIQANSEVISILVHWPALYTNGRYTGIRLLREVLRRMKDTFPDVSNLDDSSSIVKARGLQYKVEDVSDGNVTDGGVGIMIGRWYRGNPALPYLWIGKNHEFHR